VATVECCNNDVPALNEIGISRALRGFSPRGGCWLSAIINGEHAGVLNDPKSWLTKVKLGAEIPRNINVGKSLSLINFKFRSDGRGGEDAVYCFASTVPCYPGYCACRKLAKEVGYSLIAKIFH